MACNIVSDMLRGRGLTVWVVTKIRTAAVGNKTAAMLCVGGMVMVCYSDLWLPPLLLASVSLCRVSVQPPAAALHGMYLLSAADA
jgi:hypothetical protein